MVSTIDDNINEAHLKNNNNNTHSAITTNNRKIDQSLSQCGVDYAVRAQRFSPVDVYHFRFGYSPPSTSGYRLQTPVHHQSV